MVRFSHGRSTPKKWRSVRSAALLLHSANEATARVRSVVGFRHLSWIMKIAKVVCVVLASLMVGVVAKGGPVRWVMPWMCLERCNGTTASIEANLRQLAAHSNSLSAVSYEMYNLGDGEKLVLNPLARVTENISALGLTTIPMISSYPYPPQFLDWMRQVFASPQSFETEAIAQMVQHGFAGTLLADSCPWHCRGAWAGRVRLGLTTCR